MAEETVSVTVKIPKEIYDFLKRYTDFNKLDFSEFLVDDTIFSGTQSVVGNNYKPLYVRERDKGSLEARIMSLFSLIPCFLLI